jgi:glycosyltransferase involved in cell wall biosynthesis
VAKGQSGLHDWASGAVMVKSRPPEQEMGAAKPIRVLSLIKGLDTGGAEMLLANVSRCWDPRRIEHDVAYLLPQRSREVSKLEGLGTKVYCLSDTGREFDLRWAMRLRSLLRGRGYDILHLHLRYPAAIGRLVAMTLPKEKRPRIVFTEHNVWGADVVASRIANRMTFGLDDAQIAVSPFVAESIPARRRRRLEVLIHGVDLERIGAVKDARHEARAELGVADDEVLIGTIANLRRQKGYEVLLAAAQILVGQRLPVRFAAVGHGPEIDSIKAMRADLGLEAMFQLLGERQDALRIAAGFDIFALASHFEGFPVAVMEALALGVPVVSTRVGGVTRTVRDGVEGWVVPVARPDLLAEAIRRLVVDPEERARMSKAARERGTQLDIHQAARRIEQIYREVLDVPPRGWKPLEA